MCAVEDASVSAMDVAVLEGRSTRSGYGRFRARADYIYRQPSIPMNFMSFSFGGKEHACTLPPPWTNAVLVLFFVGL